MDEAERERVFDEWLSTHAGLLFKVVRAYAFTPHDREDLLQEVAFRVWESIPRFRSECAVSTWIYRVALYSAMAWSRTERGHRDRRRSLAESEHVLTRTSSEEDPRLDWLYAEIGRLDPIDRSLCLLLLEGMSHREIAATLGISESNVAVKVHRIKRHLARRSDEGSDGLR